MTSITNSDDTYQRKGKLIFAGKIGSFFDYSFLNEKINNKMGESQCGK
jgi:hypothetical protein